VEAAVSAAVDGWTFAAGQKRCVDYGDLPPDLNPGGDCLAVYGGSVWPYLCTRPDGHRGRHAAGDGTRIVAVWP
jgi:hypothetical protein